MTNEPPEIIFEHRPDATERALRIGCGSLIGIAIAVALGIRLLPTALQFVVLCTVLIVVCSWLALKNGDRFFYEVLRWLPWV